MEPQQVLPETLETHKVEAQSCFLPGTNIQYDEAQDIACDLILKATVVGDCLECHLAPTGNGYPYLSFGRKVKVKASRFILSVLRGSWLPSDIQALHSCDNKRCIHPEHLFEGTAQDNTDDMIKKGRAKFSQPRTDHIHRTRILELHREGLTRFQIAKKLCISANTVWNYISPKGAYYVED